MKKSLKYIILVAIVVVISLMLIITNNKKTNKSDDGKFKIVTSFYPIYIMTSNLTQGAENIELTNMIAANVGCIHNYTLTTSDMKKLENADLFVKNGLGLESFSDKILETYSEIEMLDSSKDISNIISVEEETNPHIWTCLNNYIKQVKNISQKLIEENPENAEIYKKNADEYITTLSNLQTEFNKSLQHLKGKKAICLNEAFEYLGKDVNMELITIEAEHEESALSAEKLKEIIQTMKQENIKIILIDKNDNTKNAETIANETGAKIYKLNSALTGGLDKLSYIDAMTENLEILKTIK